MAETLANSAASTLNGAIDNAVTSLTVVNGTVFPATGNFRLIIDSEIIIAGARSGNTISSLTRGAEGTTATSHSNGVAVTHILTKGGLDAYLQDATHLGTGTPDNTKFLRGDDAWALVPNLIGYRVFTTSGTYTPTAGTTKILVECIGGGGGGGGVPSTAGAGNASGGGGGGGAYAAKLITTGFSGVSYAVGAAGAAGAAGTNPGGAGGDTTFNSTVVVAKGGSGGAGGVSTTTVLGGAGGLASGSTGDLRLDGGRGQVGPGVSPVAVGGSGGAAIRGGPGGLITVIVSTSVQAGTVGGQFGGGGSGAQGQNTATTAAGGAGGAGAVVVWEFA